MRHQAEHPNPEKKIEMLFSLLWKAVTQIQAIQAIQAIMSSANVFSICIPKALPIDWREVKQIWFARFPDDEVEQVDVVPYKPDHALAGYVKIFVHWSPQSESALKMRAFCERCDKNEFLVNGQQFPNGVEKWACSRSRVARKERKQKEVSAQVVEYAEPYDEVPQPPSSPPQPVPPPADAI